MVAWLRSLFDPSGFPPRWECGVWSPELGWTHVLADVATWGAYSAIPLVLIYFTRRRQDLPFPSLFLLFSMFILACGTGHLLDAVIFWHPLYRLSAAVKVATASVSWAAVIALGVITPRAMTLKSAEQLEREINRRKEAEEELRRMNASLEQQVAERTRSAERASRSKSEFLAKMSHEVRTPMSAILGYAEVLSHPSIPAAERKKSLAAIRRNGDHLLQLISDVLDVSKIEAGKLEIDLRPYSPVRIVDEAISTTSFAAKEEGIRIERIVEGRIPRVVPADPTRVRQILINLVGNALKHSKGRTVQVVLRVEDKGDRDVVDFCIDVADDGQGISKEHLARIFEPFEQGDNSARRTSGGAGLGLAISRNLAEAHGGGLTVESELNKGATFTLRLPIGRPDPSELVEDPPSEAVAPTETRDRPAATGRGRVLIADDGVDNQNILRFFLGSTGLELTFVSNGREAVDAGARRPFDLVLMDMQMPVMDGYEAARLLRRSGFRGPIVAFTAHAMQSERQRCLAAGCSDFIAKPVDRDHLIAKLTSLLVDSAGSGGDAARSPGAPASDAAILTLLRDYAVRLPAAVGAVREARSRGAMDALAARAHDVKGSAGSYGFSEISEAAGRLCDALSERPAPEAIDALVEGLCEAMLDASRRFDPR